MEYTTIDKISENLDGKRKPITSSDRTEGNIPYYGASGIVDYVEDYIFNESLLLVSEDGANLLARSTPIAFSIEGKTWVNNHAHVLRFSNTVQQKYVELYLNHISLEAYITGSAQPKLNQKKLNEIPIPVVPAQEMAAVVTTIEKIQNIIRKRNEELVVLDNLTKARFVELFENSGYEKGTVSSVLDTGFWLMPATPEFIVDGEVPYITSKNIKNRAIDFDNVKYISKEAYNSISANRPTQKGDILVSMIGTLGQTAVIQDEREFYGQNLYLLRLNKSIVDTTYFCEFFNTDTVQYELQGKRNQSTQAYLKANHVEELMLPLPPMALQKEFADFVKQIDKSKVAVQNALNEAQLLFESLMQKYFG